MNWYLWFLVVIGFLAAFVYLALAIKGTGFTETSERKTILSLVLAAVGLTILFITTGPLNIFGWLYVAYIVSSSGFYAVMGQRKFYYSPWVCLLLAVVCALWPILILTVGFGI